MRRRFVNCIYSVLPALSVALCVLGGNAGAGKIDDSKYLGVLFGLGQGGLTTPVPWSTE